MKGKCINEAAVRAGYPATAAFIETFFIDEAIQKAHNGGISEPSTDEPDCMQDWLFILLASLQRFLEKVCPHILGVRDKGAEPIVEKA